MDGIDRFRAATGLPIAPYFSAAKLLWLLEHVPGLREAAQRGEAVFGTVDTWLVYKLTGGWVGSGGVMSFVSFGFVGRGGCLSLSLCGGVGVWVLWYHPFLSTPPDRPTTPTTTGGAQHITDVTNASRTLLMDIETLQWDENILATLSIPRAMLPDIKSSSEVYGTAVGALEGVRLAGGWVGEGVLCGSWLVGWLVGWLV